MENQPTLSDPIEPQAKKSRLGLIAAGVLVAALLIGAAFIAGRLLKRPASTANEGGMMIMGDGSKTAKTYQMERPKELPDRPPDVTGTLQRIENNSILVSASSGPLGIVIHKEGDTVAMNTEGDDETNTIEVVITRDTEVYRDVTAIQVLEGNQPPGKIEQEIVPTTLDELEGQAIVVGWGERKGDRLIAEVVLFNMLLELGE